MKTTIYQAQVITWELTRRKADAFNRVVDTLADIPVDLTPHQIDAAVVALNSPFSKGVILADEVGLGKTIEAGIVLAQRFAEGKKRALVVCSNNLLLYWRKQMIEHFRLPCRILDELLELKFSSLDIDGVSVISYPLCAKWAEPLAKVPWNLVVFDDAQLLKNTWKHNRKAGSALLSAFASFHKILMTAAPLQNSLMELWTLMQFIDPEAFPNAEVFYDRYVHSCDPERQEELHRQLAPYFKRTLRRQVLPFMNLPGRRSVTISYRSDKKQEKLLLEINGYLFGKEARFSVPKMNKGSFALTVKKSAASSLSALTGTLETFLLRLKEVEKTVKSEDVLLLKSESEQIQSFIDQTKTITNDPKLQGLVQGLKTGLDELVKTGAKRKAIIFTSSIRTQEYLIRQLEENGYTGKVLLYNGKAGTRTSRPHLGKQTSRLLETSTNRNIQRRQAIFDTFADDAEILVATDAAAIGLDLPFCSLVVNYDLPWNPAMLESRIGRCHRYGQKHEVVVINFLDESNTADVKLHSLYKERLRLFDGVFNASDEVFGSLQSGKRIEKQIVDILKSCRTTAELEKGFTQLQNSLSETIQSEMTTAKRRLCQEFDEEVRQRFQLRLKNTTIQLNETTELFWRLLKFYYSQDYEFNDEDYTFRSTGLLPQSYYLTFHPVKNEDISLMSLRDRRRYLAEHRLEYQPFTMTGLEAQQIFNTIRNQVLPPVHLVFKLPDSPDDCPEDAGGTTALAPCLHGISGLLRLDLLTVHGYETTESLVYTLCDAEGHPLPSESGRKMLLYGHVMSESSFRSCPAESRMDALVQANTRNAMNEIRGHYQTFFNEESARLEYWATSLEDGLEADIKRISKQIEQLDRQAQKTPNRTPEQQLEYQKRKSGLEKLRNAKRRSLFDDQDKIEERREAMISGLQTQLDSPKTEIRHLLLVSFETV